jgi:hypothetical protein
MHANDVPVAVGASDLQPHQISRSALSSCFFFPAAAPCNPLRYYRITTYFTSLPSRFGGECTGTEQRICTERGVISLTAGTQTLQAR